MYFSDRIKLRTITVSRDSAGFETEAASSTKEVWANTKSINRSEFYAANSHGIELSRAFQVHIEDYSGQTQIEFDTKIYEVVRTYQKGEGIVELVCSDKKING